MDRIAKIVGLVVLAGVVAALCACSPEVGSEEWCKDLQEKSKKDWTAGEAADYTRYCIFKLDRK